jgi:hypothetical protein
MIKRVIAFLSLEDMAVVLAAYTWVCTSSPSPALARSSSDNKLSSTSSLSADDPACARGNIRMLSKEEGTTFFGKGGNGDMPVWPAVTSTFALLDLWRKLGRSSGGDLLRRDMRNKFDASSTVFCPRRGDKKTIQSLNRKLEAWRTFALTKFARLPNGGSHVAPIASTTRYVNQSKGNTKCIRSVIVTTSMSRIS